jgi:sterol 24-C-methyltransferase
VFAFFCFCSLLPFFLTRRLLQYKSLVNEYYDLVTTFYEWGWGESFHFGLMFLDESRAESLVRHELWLATKAQLRPGMNILDVGCGVGGPARNMARFSGADIVGINNNAYQISRAKILDEKANLSDRLSYLKGDFLHIPSPDDSFDGCYSIEATCHAPDKKAVYGEIFRVMKPGALYGAYEWAMTDSYDPNNEEHNKIKHDIMIGDALPDIDTCADTLQAMLDVGFELVETCDLAHDEETLKRNPVPWYSPLEPGLNPANFKSSAVGRACTYGLVTVLEKCRLVPAGTTHTQKILMQAADGLVKGGEAGIFTPMLFMLVRKPAP